MKIKLIGLMVSLFLLAGTAVAQTFINLTPRPKSISVKAGQQLTLPSKFSISHSGLDEEEVNEVKRFADLYAAVTGAEVSVVADDADALFQVSKLDATSKLKDSGYTLAVTFDKVNIQAKSATGFFYAFQSVKKLLPANVMAGKKTRSQRSTPFRRTPFHWSPFPTNRALTIAASCSMSLATSSRSTR